MALPVKYIPLGRAWPASPYSQWDLLAWHGPSLGLPEGPLDLIADRTGGLPWAGKPLGVFPFTQLWVHWISIIWPKTFHNPEFQCCTFFFLGYKKMYSAEILDYERFLAILSTDFLQWPLKTCVMQLAHNFWHSGRNSASIDEYIPGVAKRCIGFCRIFEKLNCWNGQYLT